MPVLHTVDRSMPSVIVLNLRLLWWLCYGYIESQFLVHQKLAGAFTSSEYDTWTSFTSKVNIVIGCAQQDRGHIKTRTSLSLSSPSRYVHAVASVEEDYAFQTMLIANALMWTLNIVICNPSLTSRGGKSIWTVACDIIRWFRVWRLIDVLHLPASRVISVALHQSRTVHCYSHCNSKPSVVSLIYVYWCRARSLHWLFIIGSR